MAGCPTEAVLEALGLPWGALFPKGAPAEDLGEPQEVYTYVNAEGKPYFQVCRFPGKDFRQRRADGRWGLQGVRRVLYRLPEVLAEAERGGTIYVVEGEKDVHALEALGVVATCNPGGAGKWKEQYTHAFRGASRVIVVSDFDDPGYKHAAHVAVCASEVAPVLVVKPKESRDVADHLEAGYGLDDFIPVLCSRQSCCSERSPS